MINVKFSLFEFIMIGTLILEDGTKFNGLNFGGQKSTAGEVVFSTAMVGYPESLTDPSYKGQILILTYPLIGSYGVADKQFWESPHIQVSGLIVSDYINTPSHFQSKHSLGDWFKKEALPLLQIKDTRFLTQKIRTKGTMLGKIIFDTDIKLYDPNTDNLVALVSTKKMYAQTPENPQKTVILIDCGAKQNITRCLLKRGVRVITVPWNYDIFKNEDTENFDGLVISNGPGDPKMAKETIETIKIALENKIPTLGICLGNQLLALAAGGDTYKLKFGHRSQNQPCLLADSKRCFITTQNHGFAVSDSMPHGFKPWFTNANDNSNEGIIHQKHPFMSVQFHPEASAGPMDTEWIFDYFLEKL